MSCFRAQTRLSALIILPVCIHSICDAGTPGIKLNDHHADENARIVVAIGSEANDIRQGDSTRPAEFSHMARTCNPNRQNATAQYSNRYDQPDAESKGRRQSPAIRNPEPRDRKKPRDFGLRVGMNYSFPSGKYYEGFTSGIGFGGDIIVPITANLAIRGTASKSGMKDDLISLLDDWELIQDDMTMNTWRFAVSLQYYVWPRWQRNGHVIHYVYWGLGVVSHSLSGSITVLNAETRGLRRYHGGHSENEFMITLGGGLVSMVSGTLGIETGTTLDMVFLGRTSDDFVHGIFPDMQYAFIFDLKLGLVALF